MDVAAEIERNPVCQHQIQPEYGDEQAETRDGIVKLVSRDRIVKRKRGQGSVNFPIQLTTGRIGNYLPGWSLFAICDCHTYIHSVRGMLDQQLAATFTPTLSSHKSAFSSFQRS